MAQQTSKAAHAAAGVVRTRLATELWRRGLSQQPVAKALGINQSTLSKKLRGVVPLSLLDVVQLAALLDLELAQLVAGVDARLLGGVDLAADARWTAGQLELDLVDDARRPAPAAPPAALEQVDDGPALELALRPLDDAAACG